MKIGFLLSYLLFAQWTLTVNAAESSLLSPQLNNLSQQQQQQQNDYVLLKNDIMTMVNNPDDRRLHTIGALRGHLDVPKSAKKYKGKKGTGAVKYKEHKTNGTDLYEYKKKGKSNERSGSKKLKYSTKTKKSKYQDKRKGKKLEKQYSIKAKTKTKGKVKHYSRNDPPSDHTNQSGSTYRDDAAQDASQEAVPEAHQPSTGETMPENHNRPGDLQSALGPHLSPATENNNDNMSYQESHPTETTGNDSSGPILAQIPDTATAKTRSVDKEGNNNGGNGSTFRHPPIHRYVYSERVKVKAHSTFPVVDHEEAFYNEFQSEFTPYIEGCIGDVLTSYSLTISHTAGKQATTPDHSKAIVSKFDISTILEVYSTDFEDLVNPNTNQATKCIEDFIESERMYAVIGKLRNDDIDIVEVALDGKPFRSPVLADTGGTVSAATGIGNRVSPQTQKRTAKAGLYAAIGAGLLVVVAVGFATLQSNVRRRWLAQQDDLGSHDSDSFINSSQTSSISITDKLQAVDVPKMTTALTTTKTKMMTRLQSGFSGRFAGSFHRQQATGSAIKPAAIQKKPAFSKDIMSTNKHSASDVASERSYIRSVLDDQSLSMAGDYNVPNEYDFKVSTPVSDIYNNNKWNQQQKHYHDEEFSMPEEYGMVTNNNIKKNKRALPYYGMKKNNATSNNNELTTSNYNNTKNNNNTVLGLYEPESPASMSHYSYSYGQDMSPVAPMSVPSSEVSTSLHDFDQPNGRVKTQMTDIDEWSVESYTSRSNNGQSPPSQLQQQQRPNQYRNNRSSLDMPPLL